MNQFSYYRASTVKAAIDAASRSGNTRFIAGGTNLLDLMKSGVLTAETLVDINKLPLREIRQEQNRLHIGALVLNSSLAENDIVKKQYPLLSEALLAGASPQLRNMATVGGNLLQRTRCTYFYDTTMPCNKRTPGSGCGAMDGINRMHAIFGVSDQCIAVHPSDMCVALAALDANILVAGPKGQRTIAMKDFHRLPGNTPQLDNTLGKTELITAVEIPAANFTNWHYLKVRDRASYAFALVSVAVALQVENNRIKDARIALGGVASKPWRLPQTEQLLKGQAPTADNFRKAAEKSIEGAVTRTYNAFKPAMVVNSIQTALLKSVAI